MSQAKAKFFIQQGQTRQAVAVSFFNPVSLQYTVTNTLAQQGDGRQQYVSQSTAKLTMDLVFDTTDTGKDVRLHTNLIANLMEPKRQVGTGKRALPDIVVFEWGLFSFQGMVESYKETIDFFSADGVPLRASVNLGLSRQANVFSANPKDAPNQNAAAKPPQPPEPPLLQNVGEAAIADLAPEIKAPATANGGGIPDALRRIGAANMLESLRHVTEALAIPRSLPAPGGARGVNAALPGGSGGEAGDARALSARVGGALSAGVGASAGAFAGLRLSTAIAAPIRVDVDRLLSKGVAETASIGASAEFQLGGQVELQTGAGFSADVGATASLRDQLLFDE
jgi:hypothetical protein